MLGSIIGTLRVFFQDQYCSWENSRPLLERSADLPRSDVALGYQKFPILSLTLNRAAIHEALLHFASSK